MQNEEKLKLTFRRQYIIVPNNSIKCPFLNHTRILNCYFTLYSHIDLTITDYSFGSCKLILMGDIIDSENPQFGNREILKCLAIPNFKSFLEKLSCYAGRYVIIYVNLENIFLVHDAASARKIYYHCRGEQVYCSSQPNLLAKILNLEPSSDLAKIRFYHSSCYERLNNSNIGNTTRFDNIYQILPNHYLSISPFRVERYWPNRPIVKLPLYEVVSRCANMIEGFIKGIGNRYNIMLPVTAGKDSRLLFAATRSMNDKVFYYINKERYLQDNSYDITIPMALLKKLGLQFHILDPYIETDNDFEEIYFQNNPYASKKYLPLIYNYYVNFSDKVNLPGIFINIIEDVFEHFGREILPKDLANLIHVEEYDYAVNYFSSWLNGCKKICKEFNLNVLNLLYWEERIANWGTQIQLDKDIAQEDIIPYNSRMLIETLLSADLKYREKPDFTVFKEIIRMLFPEALKAPFNPGFKNNVLKITKTLGIMNQVKRLYYFYKKN